MKRLSIAVVVMAATMLLTATAAQAVPAPKTTGSIVMSNPKQAATFDAFDTNPVKGSVTYTNFEFAVDGTGVWVPAGTFDVDFEYQGTGPYTHVLSITGFEPGSPDSVSFTATGYYEPDPGWTETVQGTIDGDQISFTMLPDDGGLKYGWTYVDVVGTIDPDGSVAGTWSDSLTRSGGVTIADIGYEAFSYTAPVTCADVTGTSAVFGFTIPTAPLAGTPVAVHVTDGGSPGAGNDTWAHGVGDCTSTSFTDYQITAGNLTVHA